MTQITITRIGTQGSQGPVGNSGIPFTFSTTTTQADPGAGGLRLNNAALASVTAGVLDALSAATGNPDVSDAIKAYGAGTSTKKARMRIAKASAADEVWAEYDVTGITDNTTHLSLALTYVDHVGSFTDSMAVYVSFVPVGDKGVAGDAGPVAPIVVPLTNSSSAFSAEENIISFPMPQAVTFTSVRAWLATAQTGGAVVTVDVKKNGTSIFSTKITIDNGEQSSTTANTPAVISSGAFAVDDVISFDIDQVGDGTARGLVVILEE